MKPATSLWRGNMTRPFRFRVRALIIAIGALAIPAAFFRPDSQNDPTFLSVIYCAIIVAGFVQLLIYAISLVRITTADNLDPESGQSSEAESGPKRRGAARAYFDRLTRRMMSAKHPAKPKTGLEQEL
jgi:hypothetical protein